MIRKRRKIVDGVEITLLEKSIVKNPVIDLPLFYVEVESKLKSYVDTQLTKIEQTQTTQQEAQTVSTSIPSESLSSQYVFTQDDFLGVLGNSPEEGGVLTYDDLLGAMVWRQSPNIRLNAHDDIISNYLSYFNSDHIKTKLLHVAFNAGDENKGIQFLDHTLVPNGYYGINMGPTTGYTYSNTDGNHGTSALTMRFTNSTNAGRGFSWFSRGGVSGHTALMSLDNQGWVVLKSGITFMNGFNFEVEGVSDASDGYLPAYNSGTGHIELVDQYLAGQRPRTKTKYYDSGSTVTGTTILSGGAWDFKPTGDTYSWNFIEDGIQYRSGPWDHALFFDDDTNYYHIVSIRTVQSGSGAEAGEHPTLNNATFMHAKTKNFSAGTFEEVGVIDALGDHRSGSTVYDGHLIRNIWAPHIIKYDSAFYMFYAGVEYTAADGYDNGPGAVQRIFAAKSYDIEDWSRPEITFLLDGDASFTTWDPSGNWTHQCRDPHVVFDDVEQNWKMFSTIAVAAGYSDAGIDRSAIGIASAETLMSGWELYDWVRATESSKAESPSAFSGEDGLWYLTWTKSGDVTRIASASTLSNGTGWTSIISMDGGTAAQETIKSPYQDNLWIVSRWDPAHMWGHLTFDTAITFTGGGTGIAYTSHTSQHADYSATSFDSLMISDEVMLGHIAEKNIHYDINELDNRFAPISVTGSLSATSISASSIQVEDYIYHMGDANTYFGFPSSDNFDVHVNGIDILNAIGTTNTVTVGNDSTVLSVNSNILYATGARVEISGNTGTELFTVQGNSEVNGTAYTESIIFDDSLDVDKFEIKFNSVSNTLDFNIL